MTTKYQTKESQESLQAIADTVYRSRETRCACGSHGSWDAEDTVHGTSGPAQSNVIWAGCTNCRGSAVGVPLSTKNYSIFFGMHAARQRELIGVSAIKRKIVGDKEGVAIVRWPGFDRDNQLSYRVTWPNEYTQTCVVKFDDGIDVDEVK